jgi:hypothetical protein
MDQGDNKDDIVLKELQHIEIFSMRVMPQAMMESLQKHLPMAKRGESVWLQYSLVKDGASIETMLDKCRGTKYSVFAVKTIEG